MQGGAVLPFLTSRLRLDSQSTNITHNEIWNASDGSIESGWGWGGGDYDTNNLIVYNKIVNSNWVRAIPIVCAEGDL
jgi:hypothetical protein